MSSPVSDPLNSTVLVAAISTLGGVLIAYLGYIVRQKRLVPPAKDRMDTIFEGYEKLLKQQQTDIDRKSAAIISLEGAIQRLEEEVTNLRDLLGKTRQELSTARTENDELKTQLADMRHKYNQTGTV